MRTHSSKAGWFQRGGFIAALLAFLLGFVRAGMGGPPSSACGGQMFQALIAPGRDGHASHAAREALSYLQDAVARDPNDSLAYSDLEGAQIEAEQPRAAFETLEGAERRFRGEASFPAQLSRFVKTLGESAGAAKQAALAESLNRKNNPELQPGPTASRAPEQRKVDAKLQNLAQCVEREDAACASAVIERLDGAGLQTDAAYLDLKAEALNLLRRRTEALAAVREAIKIDPNQPAYFITEGRINQRLGHQAAAIQSFLRAEQLRPGAAGPVYDIGMSFFLMGDYYNEGGYYQRAAQHFNTALELNPRDDRAEFMLGAVNVIEFKLDDAKRDFEQALQMSPQNPYYHLHYGILLSRLGDQSGALGEMRTAEKLDPTYARTYFSLGEVLEQTGSYKEAKDVLETGVRLEPDFAPAYYTLGRVDFRLGLRKASQAALQKFERLKNISHEPDTDPMTTAISAAESKYKPDRP